LEKNWNAQEEIDLLDGISDSGFQNWKEVAKQVQSKTEEGKYKNISSSRLEKGKFQLALWTSSSQMLLVLGKS